MRARSAAWVVVLGLGAAACSRACDGGAAEPSPPADASLGPSAPLPTLEKDPVDASSEDEKPIRRASSMGVSSSLDTNGEEMDSSPFPKPVAVDHKFLHAIADYHHAALRNTMRDGCAELFHRLMP